MARIPIPRSSEEHLMDDVDVERRLRGTHYLVEANDYESLSLWREYHGEHGMSWQQLQAGFWTRIGMVGKLPVVVSFHMDIVNGKKITFYHATSQIVDHALVEAWLAEHLPGVPKTDAMNFHHAVDRI